MISRSPRKTMTLNRDCDAILIPSGMPIALEQGTEVVVTQCLGGSYTVEVNGNLVRIAGHDVEALGEKPLESELSESELNKDMTLEEQVWAQLKTCYDPEIPVDIVELGLIYHCRLVPLTEGGHNIFVVMTLTAPGCGMGPILTMDVKQKLLSLPGVKSVDVELVFDPPWDRNRMSEAARLQLGLL